MSGGVPSEEGQLLGVYLAAEVRGLKGTDVEFLNASALSH